MPSPDIIKVKPKYDDLDTRFRIYWKLTGCCNYQCTYCFNNYGNNLDLTIDGTDNIRRIARYCVKVFNAKNSGYLYIMGGEPTIHADLLNVVNFIKLNTSNVNIGILTNLSAHLDCYKALLDLGVMLMSTWHQRADDDDFIKKLLCLNAINPALVQCKVMYTPETADRFSYVYNSLQPYVDVLDCGLVNQINYDIDFLDEVKIKSIDNLEKYITVCYRDGHTKDMHSTDYKKLSNSRNFLGWLCASGKHSIFIENNGEVYPCNGYSLGRLSKIISIHSTPETDWIVPNKETLCELKHCTCSTVDGYRKRIFY